MRGLVVCTRSLVVGSAVLPKEKQMDVLEELRFAVDDIVVYASHGVGRVAARDRRNVVLEFAERGLSVTLPIERAVECVRAVSTEDEIASIGRTLGEAYEVSGENWQRRLKATRGKVAVGEAVGLAEVIRDASRRGERATARKEPGKLSLTERQLCVKARQLLADEIGASRGVDPAEADAWIGDQIAAGETGCEAPRPLAPLVQAASEVSGRRARRRKH
jgi:RNA polymerase-interacting CarD/CdnL/TRCF family regulator